MNIGAIFDHIESKLNRTRLQYQPSIPNGRQLHTTLTNVAAKGAPYFDRTLLQSGLDMDLAIALKDAAYFGTAIVSKLSLAFDQAFAKEAIFHIDHAKHRMRFFARKEYPLSQISVDSVQCIAFHPGQICAWIVVRLTEKHRTITRILLPPRQAACNHRILINFQGV